MERLGFFLAFPWPFSARLAAEIPAAIEFARRGPPGILVSAPTLGELRRIPSTILTEAGRAAPPEAAPLFPPGASLPNVAIEKDESTYFDRCTLSPYSRQSLLPFLAELGFYSP